jgi:hypothetical protein
MVWGVITSSAVPKLHVLPPNETVRAKYNQEHIVSLFLPDDIIWPGETGILQKEDSMKICWI